MKNRVQYEEIRKGEKTEREENKSKKYKSTKYKKKKKIEKQWPDANFFHNCPEQSLI